MHTSSRDTLYNPDPNPFLSKFQDPDPLQVHSIFKWISPSPDPDGNRLKKRFEISFIHKKFNGWNDFKLKECRK